jgi:hypothetical protein
MTAGIGLDRAALYYLQHGDVEQVRRKGQTYFVSRASRCRKAGYQVINGIFPRHSTKLARRF